MAPMNPAYMLLMFFQLFMAAVIALGTLALSGVSPIIGTTTSAVSGIAGALATAIMALPGIGSLMATATDGFSLAIYITGLVFGVADRSLTPLQLYRPFYQIMTCLSGIYSKITTIFLIGGPVLAVVLLFLFPALQQGVDDAWCVFDVFFSFLEWIGAVVAPIYNIVAPQMNIFGYYIYLFLNQVAEELLTYTVFFFTVAIRVITDPASLICNCGDAPLNSCVGFQDVTIFKCVPAQLRCAVIELLRFGIDTLLHQIIFWIPDIGPTLWPVVHDVAWLYVDSTTMISLFLANTLAAGTCGPACSSVQTTCTLEFDTPFTCCPPQFLKIILCRFFGFSQFVPLLLALLNNIPIIGQIIQLVTGLADFLAHLLNTIIIDPINSVLVQVLQVIIFPINVVMKGICAIFWAIDPANVGKRAPKPCCNWCIAIPPNVKIPPVPSLTGLISDVTGAAGSAFGCGAPSPPPPPTRRRRRMLTGEDDDDELESMQAEYDRQQQRWRQPAVETLAPTPAKLTKGRVLPRPVVAKTPLMQPKPPAATGVPEWDKLRLQSHRDTYGSTGFVGMHGASWLPPWQPVSPAAAAAASRAGVQHAYAAPPWKKMLVVATIAAAMTQQQVMPRGLLAIGSGVAPPPALPFASAVVIPAMGKLQMSSISDPAMGRATQVFRSRSLLGVPSQVLDYSTGLLHVLVEVIGGALTLIASAIIRVTRWVISNTAGQLGLICRGPISNIILFIPEQLFKVAYGYTPPPAPVPPSGTCSLLGDLLYPVQWVLDAAFSVTCAFDAFGVINELDGSFLTAVDDFDIWSNNLVLNFLNALPRAEQWLQTMLNVLLNLNLNAPFGFLAYLYSLIECSSPGSYNPITNPDPNAYQYGCLLHLLVPPVAPPFPTVSATIDWGLTCIGLRTNLGSFGGVAYVTIPGGQPIFCKCTEYETCDEKFPSGASVASALFSGSIEWASAIIQGVTADGNLAFSVVTLINFEMPIIFNIPPIINIDTVLRPITLIPYAQDFLLCGLNSTNNVSLARPLFPGGMAPLTTITPNAGAACVVVRFPAMVKDVIVGAGFLAIFAASIAIVAAYATIALNFYWAIVVAILSYITTFIFVISYAFNRHQIASLRQDVIILDQKQRRLGIRIPQPQPHVPAAPSSAPLPTGAQLADLESQGENSSSGGPASDSPEEDEEGYEMENFVAEEEETDQLLDHDRGFPRRRRNRGGPAPRPEASGWAMVKKSDGWEMFSAAI